MTECELDKIRLLCNSYYIFMIYLMGKLVFVIILTINSLYLLHSIFYKVDSSASIQIQDPTRIQCKVIAVIYILSYNTFT